MPAVAMLLPRTQLRARLPLSEILYPGRIVIGVDTGLKLRYVYGNQQGLLGYGQMTDYMPDSVNKLALTRQSNTFLKHSPTALWS